MTTISPLIILLLAFVGLTLSQGCVNNSDCPTSKPYCDSFGFCNECVNSSNCRADDDCDATCSFGVCLNGIFTNCLARNKYCDRTSGTCIDCLSDKNCTAKYNLRKYCEPLSHSCVQCSNNSMCTNSSIPFCNSTGLCAQCLTDRNCANSQACVTGVCRPCAKPNSNDAHCPLQTPFCNANYQCVQCLADSTCISNSSCDGTCRNGACRSTVNCTANTFTNNTLCNTNTKQCVQCFAQRDCTTPKFRGKPYCYNNTCVGCTSDNQCVSGYCHSTKKMCVECRLDTHCREDSSCNATCSADGVCQREMASDCTQTDDICQISTGECVGCLIKSDCASYNTGGRTFFCHSTLKICVECQANSDCPNDVHCNSTCDTKSWMCNTQNVANCTADKSHPYCSLKTKQCVECTQEQQCTPRGLHCDTNSTCVQCTLQSHCSMFPYRKYCIGGQCHSCAGDTECRNNTNCDSVCVNNECSKGTNCSALQDTPQCIKSTGQCVQCYSNNHCSTGYCDTTKNKCVECLQGVHCRNNSFCDASCTDGVCVAGQLNCTKNGAYCDTPTAQCVECLSSVNCKNPEKPVCYNKKCEECGLLNNDCKDPNKPYCSTNHTCENCLRDAHCRSKSDCDATCDEGTCVSGVLSCPNYCDAEIGQCYQCDYDYECNTKRCNLGFCVDCKMNLDCRSDTNCDAVCTSGGKCVGKNVSCDYGCDKFAGKCYECKESANCNTDEDCGATCVGNACIDVGSKNCTATNQFCSPKGTLCIDCTSSDDCKDGKFCNSVNMCVLPPIPPSGATVGAIVGGVGGAILLFVVFLVIWYKMKTSNAAAGYQELPQDFN